MRVYTPPCDDDARATFAQNFLKVGAAIGARLFDLKVRDPIRQSVREEEARGGKEGISPVAFRLGAIDGTYRSTSARGFARVGDLCNLYDVAPVRNRAWVNKSWLLGRAGRGIRRSGDANVPQASSLSLSKQLHAAGNDTPPDRSKFSPRLSSVFGERSIDRSIPRSGLAEKWSGLQRNSVAMFRSFTNFFY